MLHIQADHATAILKIQHHQLPKQKWLVGTHLVADINQINIYNFEEKKAAGTF